ncbi:MAG TPA: hypothetical protein VHA76_12375 [Solirubrobacterales bacterium]|nr:hypothetical protein [Solirubrobacterales bacterium]
MRKTRQISRRLTILAIAALAAGAALAAVGVAAAGPYAAHAARPAYDKGALELKGRGGYATLLSHAKLRVTVCLQKRIDGRAFPVRCETGTGAGRRVSAEVGVPGCVKGSWRTTATGEALNRKGEWVGRATATSAPFKC